MRERPGGRWPRARAQVTFQGMPRRLPLALVSLLVLVACGRSDAASRLDFSARDESSSYMRSSGEPPLEAPVDPSAPSLDVPPDRALLDLSIGVVGQGFSATADRTREVIEAVAQTVRGGDGCEAHWIDHTPPTPRGDDGEFRGEGRLRIDVALADLSDTAARAARLDACVARLETADLGAGVHLRLSSALVTVDDPQAHGRALLKARLAPLHELAATIDAPPQYEPAGVRCRSTGAVSIVERRLSGVTLTLDFSCAPSS
jgi:hypothetical protein